MGVGETVADTLTHRSGDLLTDTEIGLAQVQLLRGWRCASNTPGVMQAADPLRRRFLFVMSESRGDFTHEMDIREYSRRTFSGWVQSGRILEIHDPKSER